MTIVTLYTPDPSQEEELHRSVTLSNEDWSTIALCVDSYASTFRTRQSEIVTTYVTRGQLPEATAAAAEMNRMLQKLDQLQAKL
jgi:hypothetical protein